MEYTTLNNGVKMPMLGYGVYQIDPAETERCVLDALSVGYRSIDTAQIYMNEEAVGNAIKKSGIPRDQIFLTSKVWMKNFGKEKAKASIERSLKRLQTDYLDLCFIHHPYGDYYGAYQALEDAYREGKVRAIGISNFNSPRFIDMFHFSDIKPAVNQMETHVFQQQKELKKYLDKYNVQLEAWGSFAEGKNDYFNNPVLKEVGEKHGKTAAQTALRFLNQSNVVLIPKSVHKDRMEQNFNIFDFTLDAEDMAKIEALDTGKNLFWDHNYAEWAEIFVNAIDKSPEV